MPFETFTGMQSMQKPKLHGGNKTNKSSKRSNRDENLNNTPSKQLNNSFVNYNINYNQQAAINSQLM